MTENQELNMQTQNEAMLLEPLQKLNLLDDFLFDVTTVDLESCKIIIELSLGIQIKEIRWKENQKVVHNLPGNRGIRMDFYAEDVKGNIFDVEMQKRNEGNIPKRTRFYQALIDAPLLKSGENGFDHLNATYIVVICGFDLFGYGKYRYTFSNKCEEVPGLELGDQCKKIILNTRGNNDQEVEQSLIDFLHYIEKSDDSSISETCDARLKNLHNKVKKIKASEQIGVTYMKMEERDRLIRVDGYSQGHAQGHIQGEQDTIRALIQKKLANNKSIEKIADELETTVEEIQKIMTEMGESK
jgi:predicted transposase/invertase (TIGR01784 family)